MSRVRIRRWCGTRRPPITWAWRLPWSRPLQSTVYCWWEFRLLNSIENILQFSAKGAFQLWFLILRPQILKCHSCVGYVCSLGSRGQINQILRDVIFGWPLLSSFSLITFFVSTQNSAAIKYLNDAQLTTVAQKSPKNNSSYRNIQTLAPSSNLTRYGLSEDHMSDATKHYLSQHRLDSSSDTGRNQEIIFRWKPGKSSASHGFHILTNAFFVITVFFNSFVTTK